jgi:hypothetical protein
MISDDQSVMLLKAEGILLPYGKSIVEAAQFYASITSEQKIVAPLMMSLAIFSTR